MPALSCATAVRTIVLHPAMAVQQAEGQPPPTHQPGGCTISCSSASSAACSQRRRKRSSRLPPSSQYLPWQGWGGGNDKVGSGPAYYQHCLPSRHTGRAGSCAPTDRQPASQQVTHSLEQVFVVRVGARPHAPLVARLPPRLPVHALQQQRLSRRIGTEESTQKMSTQR